MTYVPYSQTAPKTTDLRELHAELRRVRLVHGRGSSQGLEAFQRLNAAAAKKGVRLDALRQYSENETERFFAHTIPGPDGHTYWDGPHDFYRNDHKYRRPARWWWEHVHGTIASGTLRLTPTCGERGCITPDHQVLAHFAKERYSDQAMLGAIQVIAMRLGRTPMYEEFARMGGKPSGNVYAQRFGGFTRAVAAAGLPPAENRRGLPVSADDCVQSIRAARTELGHWPAYAEWRSVEMRAHLKTLHLPTSHHTIYKNLGPTWADVLRKAGKP